ncbi:hypothetical protein [Helicobacter equorum]|uniref:hypothetical protein n=1 Tax=Helicobacter equorum TaxID=361872 RepID=UPI000CF10108|nr:hypothetical protein [Helicobacter equorum]
MRGKLSAKTWSIAFILIIFLGSLFIIPINYYLDPFGLRSVENKNFTNLSRVSYSYLYPIKIAQKAPYYLVGTSRTQYIDLPLLSHYLHQHIISVGMRAQSFEEALTLIKALKTNGSHFVSGFDAFALNTEYELKRLEENSQYNIMSLLFNFHTLRASFQTLWDTLLSRPNNLAFLNDNLYIGKKNSYKEIEQKRFIEHHPLTKNGTVYSPYNINESQILEFAKLGDSQDIIIIFPKHAYYYKLFETYGVQETYFHAIELLVNNTKARVYSFYGVNSITRDKANFDDEAWHFKPKVGNLILAKIFQDESVEVPKDFGVELTKENVRAYLQNLRDSIQTTELD